MSKSISARLRGGSIALSLIIGGAIGTMPIARAAQPASYQRAQAALAKGKLLDARLELLNTVRQHPKDGAAHALLGTLMFQLGDPVSAEREAKKAMALHYQPNRSLALLLRSTIAQGQSIALLHNFPIGTATGMRGAVLAVARARANLVLARLDRADADLQRASAFAPQALNVYYARIDLAFARHDLAAAGKIIAEANTLAPGAPRLLRREAQLNLSAGKAAQAVPILKTAIAKDPLSMSGRLLLVQALSASNQLAQAQIALKSATHLVPNSVGAAYLQATIDTDAGHYHQAHAILQHIGRAAKQMPGIYYLQARTDDALGEPAAALTAAQHFAAQMGNNPGAQLLVAVLAMRSNHYDVARASLDKLAAAGPLSEQGLDLQASLDMHDGKWAQAAQADQQALADNPKDVAALRGLGALAQQQGNLALAEQDFRKALSVAPAQTTTQAATQTTIIEHQLAVVALMAGDIPTATQAIAALNKQGGAVIAAPLQAQLALLQGDTKGAKAALRHLLKVRPHSVQARLGLARIDLLDQKPQAALKRLVALDQRHPADPRIVVALADLQGALHQPAAAQATLEQAHQHAPANVAFATMLLQHQRATKQFKAAQGLLATLPASMLSQPVILLQRSKLDAAQGHLDQAALSLQALLAATPDDVGSRLALAHIDVARKHPHAADAVIDAGLARDPHQLALMEARVGLILSRHGLAAAQKQAAYYASNPIHMPQAALLAGQLDNAQHQWAQAAASFGAAYTQSPSPVLAVSAIEADLRAKQRDAALAMLKTAVGRFPNDVALSDMQGSVAIDQGQLPVAAIAYRHSLTLAPQDPVALDNLAWIEGKLGKQDALTLAQHAYIAAPRAQTADTLGWILLHQTDQPASRTQAVALLKSAHQQDPGDVVIAYHDAVALHETGDNAGAVAILQPILHNPAPFAQRSAAAALLHSLQPHG